jgi:hypothetical protein
MQPFSLLSVALQPPDRHGCCQSRENAGTRLFRFGEGRETLFDGMKIGNGRLAKLYS